MSDQQVPRQVSRRGAVPAEDGCAAGDGVGPSPAAAPDWVPAFVGQRPPFAPGNSAAVKSGAESEIALAPLREAHNARLIVDYPGLDERRRAILSDRLARLDKARAWIDSQAGLVRNGEGDVWPLVDRIEKWEGTADRVLADLEREAKGQAPDGVAALIQIGREIEARRALEDAS